MKLCCLDTHVLIWGVRQDASTGQEHMIQRARMFLDWLDSEGIVGLIPTVVLDEFLAHTDTSKHARAVRAIERGFVIAPYDAATASKAAEIALGEDRSGTGLTARIRDSYPDVTRQKVRSDVKILATAILRGAATLYTHDGPLARLAEPYIRVSEIPADLVSQPELYLSERD